MPRFIKTLLLLSIFSLFSTISFCQPTSTEKTISRVSLEISKAGEVIISIRPVPDQDFEKPEGKKVEIYGFQFADCFEENSFFVINSNFLQKKKIVFPFLSEKENSGLKPDQNGLLFDTSSGKDINGQRFLYYTQRRFGFPFMMDMDIHRQGLINRSKSSYSERSLNFHVNFFQNLERKIHLVLSIQPTDTKYLSGLLTGHYFFEGKQSTELKKLNFENGKISYNFKIENFPEDITLSPLFNFRGDNAILKRLRIAGHLLPTLGVELVNQGGKVSISKVLPGGPCEKAGVKENDILVALDGEKLRDVSTTKNIITKASVTNSIDVEIKRNEKTLKLKIVPN